MIFLFKGEGLSLIFFFGADESEKIKSRYQIDKSESCQVFVASHVVCDNLLCPVVEKSKKIGFIYVDIVQLLHL